jgi:hypothetical protein
LVLRTDFSDNEAWSDLCVEIQAPEPENGFAAYVDCVSDPSYDGASAARLVELAQGDDSRTFLFVVDEVAIRDPEHPVLVVDLYDEVGRTFRVSPQEIWGVENNLSISNMDFCEFADNVGADGVFRGFPPEADRPD